MSNTPKSCFNCPSLLSVDESANFFHKTIGVPVCAKFGKPIGRATSSRDESENIARTFASTCEEYGKPRPAVPDWQQAKFQVMLPDPQVLVSPKLNPDIVKSCIGCKNFVREDVVLSEAGWSAGLCSAKGKLLLASRYTIEARNCEYKDYGPVRSEIGGMYYLPEYEDNFVGVGDPLREWEKQQVNFIDPVDYPTDKEVSADDNSHGIRAWRRIKDPVGDNVAYLPIYDVTFFDDDERLKIPRTGDQEHPEDYIDHFWGTYKTAVLWTELDETPALWGSAGSGKTELFRHMAWMMCLPFERFSITGSTELDDLAGKMHFEDNHTIFKYGRLPKAWTKPSVIVIDEPNTGPNEVWQFLRPLTDNSKQLVMDMHQGERLPRHDDCYLGMAMNPAWDMKNIGANQIGDADANRMMHLYVQLPPAKLEREIIKKRCSHDGWEIPDEKLDTIMSIAEEIRKMCDDGALTMSWAIRPQIKVARALRWFDYMTAYRMASADYLEPAQSELVMDIIRANVEA